MAGKSDSSKETSPFTLQRDGSMVVDRQMMRAVREAKKLADSVRVEPTFTKLAEEIAGPALEASRIIGRASDFGGLDLAARCEDVVGLAIGNSARSLIDGAVANLNGISSACFGDLDSMKESLGIGAMDRFLEDYRSTQDALRASIGSLADVGEHLSAFGALEAAASDAGMEMASPLAPRIDTIALDHIAETNAQPFVTNELLRENLETQRIVARKLDTVNKGQYAMIRALQVTTEALGEMRDKTSPRWMMWMILVFTAVSTVAAVTAVLVSLFS